MSNTITSLLTALADGSVEVIDLSQPLSETTPVIHLPPPFANTPGLKVHEISHYDDRGPAWAWRWLEIGEHVGTHFDAPIHWITGKDYQGNSTDTIPVEKFVGSACVIDVSADVNKNPDHLVTVEQIEAWEAKHGKIPAGSWVLIRSDWSKRTDPKEFLNFKEDGPHTPGWHQDAVPFLAKERNVRGVGVETVGTDAGQAFKFSPAFPCHHLMHGANKFGLASLTNLDKLPPTGAIIVAAPLKIKKGSGSPLRVLAMIPG